MSRPQRSNWINRTLFVSGSLLLALPLASAIFFLLQNSAAPPILPPTGQTWHGSYGFIPFGIVIIALSVWLDRRSKE
jgi:hypothetical protein